MARYEVQDSEGNVITDGDGRPASFEHPNGMRMATREAAKLAAKSQGKHPVLYVAASEPLPSGESRWEVQPTGSFRPV